MHNQPRTLIISLAGLLAAFSLCGVSQPGSGTLPAKSRSQEPQPAAPSSAQTQSGPCSDLLMEAASQGGVPGKINFIHDNGNWDCEVFYQLGSGGDADYEQTRIYIITNDNLGENLCDFDSHINVTACNKIPFHGYSAVLFKGDPAFIQYWGYELIWIMPRAGNRYLLGVEYKAGGNGLNYAEALWSVAEARLAVAGADGTGQPTLPAVPGGVVPGQPGVPTDPFIPAGTGEIFGIPALVMLGSLGIPVAGALAGATLAWLLSLFGARPNPGIISSGGVPETGNAVIGKTGSAVLR